MSKDISNSVFYCFESSEALKAYQRTNTHSEALAFSELVYQVLPFQQESPESRLEQFEAILSKLEAPRGVNFSSSQKLLKTIEKLRESFIVTKEHLEHCFTELPQTPKNAFLHTVFKKYMESPLQEDWTLHVWEAINLLKNKSITHAFPARWVFVPKANEGFLFQEFAEAFKNAPQVKEITFFTPRKNVEASPPPIQYGNAVTVFHSLVQAIKESTKPTTILFHGENHELEFFKLKLLSQDCTPEVLIPLSATKEVDAFDQLYQSLCGNGQNVAENQKLWHQIQKKRTELPFKTTPEQILESLKIEIPAPKAVQATQDSPNQLLILPWGFIPIENWNVFAFAGSSLFESERAELYLSQSELDTLFQAGFPLPRGEAHRKAQRGILNALQNAQFPIWSTLDEEGLEGFEKKALNPATSHAIKAETTKTEVFHPYSIKYLSASQLETYAECPARYLYQNRLRIREEALSLDKFSLVFGQATHLALEHFFQKPRPEGDWTPSLNAHFQEALKATAKDLHPRHPLMRLLTVQFEKMLPKIQILEGTLHTLFGKTEPIYFEKEFKMELEGVECIGKIDRIDRLPNGALVVLDYKTGNVDFSPDHIEKGSNFQALLYALAVQKTLGEPCAGVLFYDLKKGELRRGIVDEGFLLAEAKKLLTRGHAMAITRLEKLQEIGHSHIATIIERLKKGDFTPTPSASTCGYCDYGNFCRVKHGLK